MCPGQPVSPQRGEALPSPIRESLVQCLEQDLKDSGGFQRLGAAGRQGGHRIRRIRRRMGNIHSDTDDDRCIRGFDQDAGYLGTADEHVIGPFQFRPPIAREECIRRIGHGERGDEAELRNSP